MSTLSQVTVLRADEDLVRVAITGAQTAEALKAARSIAAKAAHTIVGKPQNATRTADGWTVDYAPIRRRAAVPAPEVAEELAVGQSAALADMTRDELLALLAALTAPKAPAPKAPKADRPVPDFIAKARAITCRTCRDHGVVRGVGQRAGQPYRTADGAKAATAAGRSAKCPSHKRAAKAA